MERRVKISIVRRREGREGREENANFRGSPLLHRIGVEFYFVMAQGSGRPADIYAAIILLGNRVSWIQVTIFIVATICRVI